MSIESQKLKGFKYTQIWTPWAHLKEVSINFKITFLGL